MEIIFKHTWILFIAVTIANGFIFKYRSKKYIVEKPELEAGYNKFVKGWLFYGNIPWVIMAIGNLSGMTNNTFAYFAPRQMNPIVLLFHAAIIVLWGLSIWWIYFNNGAEFIEKHPGLVQKSSFSGRHNVTAKQVKLFYPLMLLGGIIGMMMMWQMDMPVLHF